MYEHNHFEYAKLYLGSRDNSFDIKIKKAIFAQKRGASIFQGQLQMWTEHSHTNLWKTEKSGVIKKSFMATYIPKLKMDVAGLIF